MKRVESLVQISYEQHLSEHLMQAAISADVAEYRPSNMQGNMFLPVVRSPQHFRQHAEQENVRSRNSEILDIDSLMTDD